MGAAELLQMVDELIQFLGGAEQHFDEHAVVAGDAVAFHNLGTLLDVGVKLRLALGVHIQIDERLDHVAQFGGVDLGLVARQDAGTFQPGDAGRHRRTGQKDMVGDFLQGSAGVFLQYVNDFAVYMIHGATPCRIRQWPHV